MSFAIDHEGTRYSCCMGLKAASGVNGMYHDSCKHAPSKSHSGPEPEYVNTSRLNHHISANSGTTRSKRAAESTNQFCMNVVVVVVVVVVVAGTRTSFVSRRCFFRLDNFFNMM